MFYKSSQVLLYNIVYRVGAYIKVQLSKNDVFESLSVMQIYQLLKLIIKQNIFKGGRKND